MPIIACKTSLLWESLGEEFKQEAFEQLCFDFGIELDDVEGDTYKIDIPANRYDLLCLEGLSRALRVFLKKDDPPVYRTVDGPAKQVMKVTENTMKVRPICVAAVLRGVTFNQDTYQSFIDLQDKLHHNICRRRTLVSIGTHDLDTIKGPFLYDARAPKDIKFVPLNKEKEVDAVQLFDDIRANELHLKPFLQIIENEPLYPVIYDSTGVVLSLPPIINGDVSKIKLSTKNVFIEVTATDKTKANIVLNTVVAMFSQYCAEKYTVEPVQMETPEGNYVTPNLENGECVCEMSYINKILGLDIEAPKATSLLKQMCLISREEDGGKRLRVEVPITRSDVLHACDIVEDVGIAYGFNNLPVSPPPTVCAGKQNELNRLTDKLRLEVAFAGFTEILTLSLCSREENFKFLRREDDNSAVVIANPKTIEFQVGRSSLLPGLLKTLNHNRKLPLPLKLFEVSDVMYIDKTKEVGATNRRHLTACYYGKRSGYEDIHGLVDRLMMVLMARPTHTSLSVKGQAMFSYRIAESADPVYLPGRCADVFVTTASGETKVGSYGILHPEVLHNFSLNNVCSVVELDVEVFL